MTAASDRVAEVRRLRTQLATLLAGVEDLQEEWETTVELAQHLRAQRRHRGQPADTTAVLADLEAVMRGSHGLPERAPQLATIPELLRAIENAQTKYGDLISQHLAWAATALEQTRHDA